MKKEYMQPSVVTVQVDPEMMVCNSVDIISDEGITYGGVDEEGDMDPSSRDYIWEDEEE